MNHCMDCKFFLPIDVFKGICKKDKSYILSDEQDKKCFEKNKKCKYCRNFTADNKKNIGKCMNKYIAYPDMVAITCKDFSFKSN